MIPRSRVFNKGFPLVRRRRTAQVTRHLVFPCLVIFPLARSYNPLPQLAPPQTLGTRATLVVTVAAAVA
jgi:hypothetical protein